METENHIELGTEERKKEDRMLWIGVALLTAYSILSIPQNDVLTGIGFLLGGGGIYLLIRDFRNLKKQGHPRPAWYWLLLVPVYLWKRGKLVDQDKRFTWAVWALAALCVLGPIVSFGFGQERIIAESAKPVVTEILQRYGNAECVKVDIDEEVAPNLYSATAILSNTKRVPISIMVRGERVLVEVLN